MKIKHCRVCTVELTDENWSPSRQKKSDHICKNCKSKQAGLWQKNNPDRVRMKNAVWQKANPDKVRAYSITRHRKEGVLPMSENKSCPLYLGVYISERVLSLIFDHVVRMPIHNPGYDFICNKGFKVDVKSSCRLHRAKGADYWSFHISRNNEAHYFLCIAFDNRDDLNPEHIWLIHADDVNHLVSAVISETTLDRWKKYELPDKLDEAISCCDTMKNENE